MIIAGVMVCGALIGFGVFLIARELSPAPPALGAALDRFTSSTNRPQPGQVFDDSLSERLGQYLGARLDGTIMNTWIPRRDLALVGKSVEGYLAQRFGMTLFGLAVPSLLWLLILPDTPWLFSGALTVGYAAVMFLGPDIVLRSKAREARQEFRVALIAYLDLVAMSRAGGAGPSEALSSPARVCQGWAFHRIAATIEPAALGTRNPWDSLAELAGEIGVSELAEAAAIARRAGTQGARILDSLTAKATSLRKQQLARELAQAKSRTETMTVPVALSVLSYLILLGYPAYARIVGG